MLPKKYRLSLKKDFLRIKKSGRYLNGELITLLYSLFPGQTSPSFGFIVSKKISNLATKRNRIKRLLHEAVWSLLPEIKTFGNFILLAKPKILNKSLIEIKNELIKLFNNETCLPAGRQ